jgi:hypothetical protein
MIKALNSLNALEVNTAYLTKHHYNKYLITVTLKHQFTKKQQYLVCNLIFTLYLYSQMQILIKYTNTKILSNRCIILSH